MNIPEQLKYTASHEWVREESDGSVSVGITDHAQDALGDLVYVQLPEKGARFERDQECAVVESVKAASDIYAPIAGTVVDVNGDLAGSPERVNAAPYETWLFRLTPTAGADRSALLDAAAYRALIESES